MKKKLIVLAIVSIATLAGTSRASAQIVSNSNSFEYQKNIIEAKNSDLQAVSPRVLKSFANMYKNVTVESWIKTKNGYSARFIANDIKTTVLYDNRGNWVGSIKNYSEEKMLREVRHIVKSTYYDYNIIYTQEIETPDSNDMPTYIICLDDKESIKFIRVCAGEMNVWKEFTKAN